MTSYFLSYASKDSERMAALVDALREHALDIWVDTQGLRNGDRWLQRLEEQLNAASAIIVMMSSAARQSEWVEREVLFAMDRGKPVFIARFDEVPMPLHLISRQFTPFEADFQRGVAMLVASIRKYADDPEAGASVSVRPSEDNFFDYLEQMPEGDAMARVAKQIFKWAVTHNLSVEFAGKHTPTLHVRHHNQTLISVVAYLRNPALVFTAELWPRVSLEQALPMLTLDDERVNPAVMLRQIAQTNALNAIESALSARIAP